MSRREDRSFDSKRHRSCFDREPSPKRSRRDGKRATERLPTDIDFNKDHLDWDQKHQRRLQDALPLEAPLAQGSKVETQALAKNLKTRLMDTMKEPSILLTQLKYLVCNRTFRIRLAYACLIQHDDRHSAGQIGRSFSHRTDTEHGWRDPKEQHRDRMEKKAVASDTQQMDEKAKDNGEDNRVWRHDEYFAMEADPRPSVRKRPSFREQKIPADTEKTDKLITNPQDLPAENERRAERENISRNYDRPKRSFMKEREAKRGEAWRGNSSRERYVNSSGFRGIDRLSTRQSYRPTGGRVEKWKHDLYEESNRSRLKRMKKISLPKLKLSWLRNH